MKFVYKDFLKKHTCFRKRAESIYIWPSNRPNWEFKYLSASLLSDIWQSWCMFCRSVILKSCTGTLSRNGNYVPTRNQLNSWQRISYEARQAAQRHTCRSSGTINFLRNEPTWGDQRVLLSAIPALAPHNQQNLLTGFGLSLNAPKHLQTVRNACFHINRETMSEVRQLMVFYTGTNLSHPVDIMWWIEPSSKSDAIFVWLEELEIIANHVTL